MHDYVFFNAQKLIYYLFVSLVHHQIMSFFATNENEKEWLQYLSSAAGRNDLYRYNERGRRTVLEVGRQLRACYSGEFF